jgi:hypothetical protein
MNYKVCTKCKINLLATNEFFPLHKRLKDGLNSCCKKCHAQLEKERRLKNPEKQKEIRARDYAKNKDQINAKRILKYNNDLEYRAKRKAVDLKYTQSGARKKENISVEAWQKNIERAKIYRLKNPEKVKAYNHYYREIKGDLKLANERKNRATLSDSYVKKVIQKSFKSDGICLAPSEIPTDFIELKRKQLNIYRDVKIKKNKNTNNC